MTKFITQWVEEISNKEIQEIIESQHFLPYDYIRGIEKSYLYEYLFAEIKRLEQKDTTHFLCAYNKNYQLCGLLVIEQLKWDSEIFKFPCARIHHILTKEGRCAYQIKNTLLSGAINWAKNNQIKFIDSFSHPLDIGKITALCKNHFYLIATHLYHIWDFRIKHEWNHKIKHLVRPAEENDFDKMINIDFSIFQDYSRFYIDEKLKKTGNVPTIFKEWIKNSLLHIRAKWVWIVEIDHKIVGFITCKEDEDAKEFLGIKIVKIDLTGVLPQSQNKGVYTDMVATVIEWAKKEDVDILEDIVHVCNAPANSLTSQLQSRVCGAHHNFHWHAE